MAGLGLTRGGAGRGEGLLVSIGMSDDGSDIIVERISNFRVAFPFPCFQLMNVIYLVRLCWVVNISSTAAATVSHRFTNVCCVNCTRFYLFCLDTVLI